LAFSVCEHKNRGPIRSVGDEIPLIKVRNAVDDTALSFRKLPRLPTKLANNGPGVCPFFRRCFMKRLLLSVVLALCLTTVAHAQYGRHGTYAGMGSRHHRSPSIGFVVPYSAGTTFVNDNGAGGYSIYSPQYGSTFVNSNGAGGYSIYSPRSGASAYVNPNGIGGYSIYSPGSGATDYVNPNGAGGYSIYSYSPYSFGLGAY
jgi:hypothetical protein